MRKTLIGSLALVAAAIVTTPAAAESVQVRVNYKDLDLTRSDHVDALKKRVRAKVRSACASPSFAIAAYSDCERGAMEQAMREIERHRLRYAALTVPPAG
ncbi:UrcA family protein [Tsuneonella sp. HG094]